MSAFRNFLNRYSIWRLSVFASSTIRAWRRSGVELTWVESDFLQGSTTHSKFTFRNKSWVGFTPLNFTSLHCTSSWDFLHFTNSTSFMVYSKNVYRSISIVLNVSLYYSFWCHSTRFLLYFHGWVVALRCQKKNSILSDGVMCLCWERA